VIDNLIVLAGGKNIYNGGPFELISFVNDKTNIRFKGDYNPVEYLLKLLGKENANEQAKYEALSNSRQGSFVIRPEVTEKLIEESKVKFMLENGEQIVREDNGTIEATKLARSAWVQFAYISQRNFQMTFRDPKTLGSLFGQCIFIAFFGGL